MKLCFLRLWVMTEFLLIKIGSIGIIRKTNPKMEHIPTLHTVISNGVL